MSTGSAIRQGIILAAGSSQRMGSPKQLMLFNGELLIQKTVRTALLALDHLIIVQGAVPLEGILPVDSRIHLITNQHYKLGRLSSLQTGLSAADPGMVLISLGDLALLKPDTWKKMAAAGNEEIPAYPVYSGKRGHPVRLNEGARRMIAEAEPGQKAMDVIVPLNPLAVEVDDPGIYLDADTPEDLARLEQIIKGNGADLY